MEKFRTRNFVAVLYPDDTSHCQCIDKLATSHYRYIAILHDMDTFEDGTKKKPHWHVVIKFNQARWNTAVAEELGISVNYLEACKSFDGSLLYLVHAEDETKYQYDAKNCFGTLVPQLNKLLADDDEGIRVLDIVNIIDSTPGFCGYREILVKCCNAGLYGEFRRLGSGVKYLLDEHNAEVKEALTGNMGVRESFDSFNEFQEWTGSKKDNIIPME